MIDFHSQLSIIPEVYETANLQDNLEHSGGITISWKSATNTEIAVGSFVTHCGTRYVLMSPYAPTKQGVYYQYNPTFKHPAAILDKTPFWIKSLDEQSKKILRRTIAFTGYPHVIAEKLAAFFAEYVTETEDQFFEKTIGTLWTTNLSQVNDIPATITVSFEGATIKGAAQAIANAIGCNVFFDWNKDDKGKRTIRFISGTTIEGDYYNCFHVLGGTTNMTKQTARGSYAAVTQRLTLPDSYKGSIIDNSNGGIRLSTDLIFDEVYPKMELYIKGNPRERVCYLTDDDGNKIIDHYEDASHNVVPQNTEGATPVYKMYSKWYIRLTADPNGNGDDYVLPKYTEEEVGDSGDRTLIGKIKLVDDKPLSLLFQPNYESLESTSPLAGRQFELVYFEQNTPEWERDDETDRDHPFVAQEGEYRIVFAAEGETLLPTTSTDGLVPQYKNKVTLVNVALGDREKTRARQELETSARNAIALMSNNKADYTTYIIANIPSIGETKTYDEHTGVVNNISLNLDTNEAQVTVGSWKRSSLTQSLRDKIDYPQVNGGGTETGLSSSEFDAIYNTKGKGISMFKSTMFCRTNETPTAPADDKGDYNDPSPSGCVAYQDDTQNPTVVVVWTDDIPQGDAQIWETSRIFTRDGLSPQQSSWTAPRPMSDTQTFDVEFAPKIMNGSVEMTPSQPDNTNRCDGTEQSYAEAIAHNKIWFDPNSDNHLSGLDWTAMYWRAERECRNGVWGNWVLVRIKGEKGDTGARGNFVSRVFRRTNTDISNVRPTGGTYDSPIPTDKENNVPLWSDGIPQGTEKLWSSVATFVDNGSTPTWSMPSQETDTADLDIEFSPKQNKPDAPSGNTPHSDHKSEYWYDPSQLPPNQTMRWRAERKIKNGVYDGDWVITQIFAESGAPGGNTATVYLYKRSDSTINTVDINKTLYYKFAAKKLYSNEACTDEATSEDLNGWSMTIPTNSTAPIYVTAATAYSNEASDDITEWVTPAQFTDNGTSGSNGINTATIFLYKRSATPLDAHGITNTLYYKFADGELYIDSTLTTKATTQLNGWQRTIPTSDKNPCYVIQAVALSNISYDAIEVNVSQNKDDWSSVRKFVEDGESIRKTGETYKYGVSTDGTNLKSGTSWQDPKPTVGEGEYLLTQVTISWSDGSSTVLVQSERNPNDGNAGMSIVVDTQKVYYSVKRSGNVTPSTINDWSETYPSSLSKGDWLYSKTEVKYKDDEGNAAGSTVSYSVSYIGVDGDNGVGISGMTEHYKASAKNYGEQGAPTTPSGNNITDWNTSPNLTGDNDQWDEQHPYLWNYEKIEKVDKNGNTTYERTAARVIAIWTKDGDTGKGIDSITNYYAISSNSSDVTKDSGLNTGESWTTGVQVPTPEKPYLWNYEEIMWINPSDTTYTDAHVIGHFGKDGKSITKKNEDVTYQVSASGATTPTGTWRTPKQAAINAYNTDNNIQGTEWAKNTFMWTKTVITWTDGTNDTYTTLYQTERNPNDGKSGMDVVVGTTSFLYHVNDSNSSHPEPNEVDNDGRPVWKILSEVTQTQGRWLWSMATTPFYKGDVSGDYAGSSVVYNVTYIAKDGTTPAAGRGITSVTEYYKATESNEAIGVQTDEEEEAHWDTDPNLSRIIVQDAANAWGENKKYLWNYEKVTYDKAPVVERTVPQIVAIWTKNGDAGRGIDSIQNYYKVTNSATPPGLPENEGEDDWKTSPIPPTNGQYLWNYEKINWTSGTTPTYTSVQLIGYCGTNGTSPYFVDIDNEMSSVACDSSGKPLAEYTKTFHVYLWHGSTNMTLTEIEIKDSNGTTISDGGKIGEVTVDVDASNNTVTVSGGTDKVIAEVTDITLVPKATGAPNDQSVHFYLNGVRAGAEGKTPTLYEIKPSANAIKKNKNGTLSPESPISVNVQKITGTTVGNAAAADGTLCYRVDGDIALVTDGTEMTIGGNVAYANTNTFITLAFFDSSNNLRDKERIPIIYDGEDGTSPWTVDLDNEMDSVPCYDNGKPRGTWTVNANISIYHGSESKTPSIQKVIRKYGDGNSSKKQWTSSQTSYTNGVYPSWTNGALVIHYNNTAVITGKDLFEIYVKDSENTIDAKKVVLTVNGVKGGVIFRLVPSANVISRSNSDVFSPSTLTCEYSKYDIESGTFLTAEGATIKYMIDDFPNVFDYTIGTTVLTPNKTLASQSKFRRSVTFLLYKDSVVVDRETVNIVYDGTNGVNCPYYIESQEKWSNDSTLTSDVQNNSGWSTSTPTNTDNLLYLWRRSRKRTWNSSWQSYEGDSAAWTYIRLNGTNGTSIKTMGTIAVAIASSGTWPTTGFSANDLGIKQGDATIWKFNGTSWVETSTESNDGDSYTMTKDCTIDLDGDGTSANIKGHLIMWSSEASKWIDLGMFKGDPGDTFYTHIAWASLVTIGTNTATLSQGQRTVPNASSVSDDFSIAPFDGASWMGILINTESADNTNALLYTWKKFSDTARTFDLSNQMDSVALDENGIVIADTTITTQVTGYYGATTSQIVHVGVYLNEELTLDEYDLEDETGIVITKGRRIDSGGIIQPTGEISVFFPQGSHLNHAITPNEKLTLYLDLTCVFSSSVRGYGMLTFSIQGVRCGKDGLIYNLLPSENAIKVADDNTYTPSTLECSVIGRHGSNSPENVSFSVRNENLNVGDLYVTKSVDGDTEGDYASVSLNTVRPQKNITYRLYQKTSASESLMIDIETVPVVKDGEAGDDASYYVDDYAISASRELSNGQPTIQGAWDVSQPSPTPQCPYVWKRSRLYNPNTNKYGTATYVCLTGERGTNGKDGWMIVANPANVLLTQNLVSQSTFTTATVSFSAKKGNTAVAIDSIGTPTSVEFIVSKKGNSGEDAKKVLVSGVNTYTPQGETSPVYYSSGSFVVDVNVTDPDTNTTVTFGMTVLCYANLLGTWRERVIGDTKSEIAASTWFDLDSNGNIVESDRLGTFIRSSKQNLSRLDESTYIKLFAKSDHAFSSPITIDTLTPNIIEKYGTSYRLVMEFNSSDEDLTITIKRRSSSTVDTYNVKSYDTFDKVLTLYSDTYYISCSKSSCVASRVALYSQSIDKYSEVVQTVNGISTTIGDSQTGILHRLETAESSITTVSGKIRNPNLLIGLTEGSGWTHDASYFNSSVPRLFSYGSTDGVILSPIITLPAGKYVFSVSSWPNSRATKFDIEVDDADNGFSVIDNREFASIEPISFVFTLTSQKRIQLMMWTDVDSFYIDKPKLESGDKSTPYSTEGDVIQSQIKQTADEIDLNVRNDLGDTGINLSDNTVTLKGNKVIFANSNGNVSGKISIDPNTGTLNAEDGNFSGTVRATNLFHNVVMSGAEYTWFCASKLSNSPYAFVEGKYYTTAEIAQMTMVNGYAQYGSVPTETDASRGLYEAFVKCTGPADIVVIKSAQDNTQEGTIVLPRAKDFEGKIVEIIDTRYTQPESTDFVGKLFVKQVDSAYVMKNDFYQQISISNTLLLHDNTSHEGGSYRMLAYKDGGTYYWVKLRNS